jgi:hypothetical protein
MLFAIVPVGAGGKMGGMLELAPWTWKGGRNVDPGIYNNVFDDLDTTPVRDWQTERSHRPRKCTQTVSCCWLLLSRRSLCHRRRRAAWRLFQSGFPVPVGKRGARVCLARTQLFIIVSWCG